MSGKLRVSHNADTAKGVASGFLRIVNDKITRRLRSTEQRIRELVLEQLLDAPEWKKILGTYQDQFGLTDGAAKVDKVCQTLSDTVRLSFSPFRSNGQQISGGVSLTACPTNCIEVLSLSEAYEYDKVNSESWNWLEWLLLNGDDIVVGYKVAKSPPLSSDALSEYSRTGKAIMIKANAGSWRTPPDVSGTAENNLIGRALREPTFLTQLENILQGLLA